MDIRGIRDMGNIPEETGTRRLSPHSRRLKEPQRELEIEIPIEIKCTRDMQAGAGRTQQDLQGSLSEGLMTPLQVFYHQYTSPREIHSLSMWSFPFQYM